MRVNYMLADCLFHHAGDICQEKTMRSEMNLSKSSVYGISQSMLELNIYQREQLESLDSAIQFIRNLSPNAHSGLRAAIKPYLEFRREIDRFLGQHFAHHCTQSCFQNRTSACCSRDGIITFWADVIINTDACDLNQLSRLDQAIRTPLDTRKCIYLGSHGCLWQVRPLVCAMFLCDDVQVSAFREHSQAAQQWDEFKRRAKRFRWPDRPVLFDQLERQCMAAGIDSPLMYLNSSPGLLQVKRKAGLNSATLP
jgi:hypothetical protein